MKQFEDLTFGSKYSDICQVFLIWKWLLVVVLPLTFRESQIGALEYAVTWSHDSLLCVFSWHIVSEDV